MQTASVADLPYPQKCSTPLHNLHSACQRLTGILMTGAEKLTSRWGWMSTRWLADVLIAGVSGLVGGALLLGITWGVTQGEIKAAQTTADAALELAKSNRTAAAGIKSSHTKRIRALRDHLDARLDALAVAVAGVGKDMEWVKGRVQDDDRRARDSWRTWMQQDKK